MSLIFGSAIKNSRFNDVDVLLVYDKNKAKEVNKIKAEIRSSGLIEQPIRYVDIIEKDAFLNKDDKIFYNILSDCTVSYNAEKYVGLIKTCRK